MSRSYKKTAYAGDKNDKVYKKIINKRLRKTKDIADGKEFKKYTCSWFIKDFYTMESENEFMQGWDDPESWLQWQFKTREEALNYYRKVYKRK
jgi:hypothetical protein